MKGNPEVISSLLDILALEAALNMQWRRDWRAIHDMGAKGSARDIKNLGKSAHRYMVLVADRILDLGGDTEYDCGSVVAFKTLTDIYRNGLTLETKLADMTQAGIDLAVEKDDEATAEKLRHIEERHEESMVWLEAQLNLIGGMSEGTYIAVHLQKSSASY